MALLDPADLPPLLVCPRCRSEVVADDGGFHCGSSDCALSAAGSFPRVGSWPAMVDFERSVVDRGELVRSVTGAKPRWSLERLPPRLRPLWKPRNRVAARNTERLLELLDMPRPLILVIGGGIVGNGVEAIYTDRRTAVLGSDIYGTPIVQLIADAHHLPLRDGSVDAVVIQAVLQQLLDPDQVVAEIHRVLRPAGLVYAETPFLQQVARSGPYDFVRYTASGHRYLFRAFDELAAGPVAGPGSQTLSSIDHLVRGVTRSELAGKIARLFFSWLRWLDAMVPTSFAMDSASAFYFLGRRSEHTLTPAEIIRYYRGAHRVGMPQGDAVD